MTSNVGGDCAMLRITPTTCWCLHAFVRWFQRVGSAARRGPGNSGLFRAASLQTRHAPFSAPGFPAIYAACVTGSRGWVVAAAQTMSVLRRIFAMSAAHAGCPGPGLPSSASPGPGGRPPWPRARIARMPFEEPVDQFLARSGDPGGCRVADDRPPVLPRGIPPNRATRSFLPSRCAGLEARPGAVTGDPLPCDGPPSW